MRHLGQKSRIQNNYENEELEKEKANTQMYVVIASKRFRDKWEIVAYL